MEVQFARTETLWDDAFFDAVKKPARLAIWVVGISIAIDILDGSSETELFQYVGTVRQVAIIIILAWFCVRFISSAERAVVNPSKMKKPMDGSTATAVAKLFRLSVFITAALIIMQTLGYSITGLLAFGGLGGILRYKVDFVESDSD